ncbi:restriction endonuclease subunit S [Solibacillus isronensis]|uniref:restriction endonuclease subunit S n=1 Tax=Solibacillus isronensis TaxID=412383 RepID=UPI0009A62D95|nr:restriction endonuclease subunit S [Solibacillus isronensis]
MSILSWTTNESLWKVEPLKKLFSFEKGKNAALYTKEYLYDNPGEYPVYSGQTENNGVMGLIDSFDYDLSECLFTTTVGAKVMTVAHLKGKFSLSQNCLIMISKNNKFNIRFYYYQLMCLFNYEKALIPSHMQPSLRMEDLKKYKILSPSSIVQDTIVSYLDNKVNNIDNLIKNQMILINLLEQQRQSIITEAVTKGLNSNVKMKGSGVEWIGDVPEHWELSKLGYIGRLQNGISKSSEEFGFGTPFISYGDVYKNEVLPKNASGLVNATAEDKKLYSVNYGDVFFTRTSETIDEIGFASTCLETIPEATFAGFLIRFRPTTNRLNPRFARFYFRSALGKRYFVKEMNLVTRASLSQGLLRNFTVLLPSLEEQEKIAVYLEQKTKAIEESIILVKNQIKKLKEYRQVLIYEAVTGKIDVSDMELD